VAWSNTSDLYQCHRNHLYTTGGKYTDRVHDNHGPLRTHGTIFPCFPSCRFLRTYWNNISWLLPQPEMLLRWQSTGKEIVCGKLVLLSSTLSQTRRTDHQKSLLWWRKRLQRNANLDHRKLGTWQAALYGTDSWPIAHAELVVPSRA